MPLLHDLAGTVLPHDKIGSHLDSSGKTIHRELQVKNFQKATEVLYEVWKKTVIDVFSVDCKAVSVGNLYEPLIPYSVSVAKHCQQSEYSL